MTYLFFVIGLSLLVAGGELLIRGALGLARHWGISPMLAGLVIVGFGTSAPELVVSVKAALSDQPAIAVGNVVGSNIGNILLILGLCAVIFPLTVNKAQIQRDGSVMLAATLLFCLFSVGGALQPWQGGVMLLLLSAYLVYSYRADRQAGTPSAELHRHEAEELSRIPSRFLLMAGFVVAGLAALIGGAQLLVNAAIKMAAAWGVPEAVVGLTVVAVGTSLPELTVSVMAAFRRHADVAVGNILGSNVFNLLGILGITSLIGELPLSAQMIHFDQWVMLAAAGLLLLFLYTGQRLSRWEGAIFLLAYVGYVVTSFVNHPIN